METVQLERFTTVSQASPHIERREIPPAVAQQVLLLARTGIHQLTSALDPRLPNLVDALLSQLPGSLSDLLRPPAGASGAAVITGFELDDAGLGPTPLDWQRAEVHELDIVMLLLARCAGIPFAWQGQQEGRLVNNIVPAQGHEHEQTGASSTVLLTPHTEDAFHPARANLLLLGCLRNHDRIGTTLSSVRNLELTADDREKLSTPTVPILPDVSYGAGHDTGAAMPVPALWENPDEGTTLRYDPSYTPLDQAGSAFRAAYAVLGSELERVSTTVALAPGEMILIDNDVSVHGRVPFTARYDGTDRWLKRVNIRLPQRRRRDGESAESGYGQAIVDPYHAAGKGNADDHRQ